MAFDPTAIFSWLDNVTLLAIKLGPEIEKWIQDNEELHKQRVLTHRMKMCVRHIKHWTHGIISYNTICEQVGLDFKDLKDQNDPRVAMICDLLATYFGVNPTVTK